jgi:isochorismate synthase
MMYRSERISETFDLNSVCRSDGFLFVQDGVGIAGRQGYTPVEENRARHFLSEIESYSTQTDKEIGPVLFGLVPFLPTESASFFLPHFFVRKHVEGFSSATMIGETRAELSDELFSAALNDAIAPHTPAIASNTFTVGPGVSIDHYLRAVSSAREAVIDGTIQKAVIARDIEISANNPIDIHAVLLRLKQSFGSSYRYCVNNVIGASPELLVNVHERSVSSHPLAGTAPRTGDKSSDDIAAQALLASTKDQTEHRVVIDMVHDTLLPYCSYLDWEPEPSIVTVANVQHLGTRIEGALSEPRAHVLDLVRLLCPTPALGGYPADAAISLIQKVEGFSRGNYGGAVGYFDTNGDGTFAVTIRCAVFSADRQTARLFAGGGIVGASEPLKELAETQAKFQAMLSAIVRP